MSLNIFSKARHLWRHVAERGQVERELDEEIRGALAILVDEKRRAGWSADAARRAALVELGGIEPLKESVRAVSAGALIDTVSQDLRYALRLLRRNPLFTLTAAISLAIGIGATTAIFTVANGLLLRTPGGVRDPGGLVDIVRAERGDAGIEPLSYPDYLDVRDRAASLAGVYAYQLQPQAVSLRVSAGAERAFTCAVTASYFEVLGVPAIAGRLLRSGDDDRPGANPVAVLSHRFWTRRFQADPAVVGTTVRINGYPFVIAGVAAPEFTGMSVVVPDIWVPMSMIAAIDAEHGRDYLEQRLAGWLMAGGRLKPGIPRSQASAEMAAIGTAIERARPPVQYFRPGRGTVTRVIDWSAQTALPIPYGLRLVVAGFLTFLMAVVSLVLVIACANLAGVLLARATVRRREIAVRSAIGAARGRVIRQLLTETLVLFALGGTAGIVLARLITSGLLSLLPSFELPVTVAVPLDLRVVAFSLTLALIAAILSGLTPALHAARADVVTALKDDAETGTGRLRLRSVFVVAQVAFSVLLVVIASLLLRGLNRATTLDRGFISDGVDAASIDLSMAARSPESGMRLLQDVMTRVRTLPGVQHASVVDHVPSGATVSFGAVTVPGVPSPEGQPGFFVGWTVVDPDYFSTLGIPLIAGRDFDANDRAGAEPVAIVGEAAAARFWPGREAVGQLLQLPNAVAGGRTSPSTVRVVGVARDLKTPGTSGRLALYVPMRQRYVPAVTILVKRGRVTVAGDLRTAIVAQDPSLVVLMADSLERQQNGPVETQLRVAATVAGGIGLVGVLLAAIGIYGVTAYAVAQRTREIGIRLSLGATRGLAIRMVLRHGMTLVGTGALVGLGLSLGAAQILARTRFNLPPPDAPLFAAALALFVLVGLAACFVPARRATRIVAMEALRCE